MFHKCAICGRNGAKVIDGKNYFCHECINLFGTCMTCVYGASCNFNDNPAPLPKIVMSRSCEQTEMGYIEQIQQIPNPQRIKAMCLDTKCICCDHEEKPHCMRQFGTCKNYKEIEF